MANQLRAEARIRRRRSGDGYRIEGDIPPAVRDRLGAQPDDVIVFEEGNTFVAERASVPGPHFVVTLRRAPAQAVEANPPEQPEPPRAPFAETWEETIARLRRERH